MCTRNQGHQQEHPRPITVRVLALGPAEGRSPWWAKIKRFAHTHIVLVVGDHVWSQPWDGKGRCVPVIQYLSECGTDREYVEIGLQFDDHDPDAWLAAIDRIDNRRTQRWRTALRHLRLWPIRPWNCTSPIRILLGALDMPIKGETPDAIIEELGWDEPTSD